MTLEPSRQDEIKSSRLHDMYARVFVDVVTAAASVEKVGPSNFGGVLMRIMCA